MKVERRSVGVMLEQNCKIVSIPTYFKTICVKRGKLKVILTFNFPLLGKYDIDVCRVEASPAPTLNSYGFFEFVVGRLDFRGKEVGQFAILIHYILAEVPRRGFVIPAIK